MHQTFFLMYLHSFIIYSFQSIIHSLTFIQSFYHLVIHSFTASHFWVSQNLIMLTHIISLSTGYFYFFFSPCRQAKDEWMDGLIMWWLDELHGILCLIVFMTFAHLIFLAAAKVFFSGGDAGMPSHTDSDCLSWAWRSRNDTCEERGDVMFALRKNKTCFINPIETHFFAQSQASGTALFWAIHM